MPINVLAFAAHPDDLECYCAGTLLKCRDRGDRLFVALTTSGNTGSNHIPTREQTAAVREAEQLACCRVYGAQTRFLRFDDEYLQDTPQTRQAVLDAIRWAKPDMILVNPPWDPSPDHGMTGRLVTQVLHRLEGQKCSVFFYATDGAVNFTPDIYVDISDRIQEKADLMTNHRSQDDWAAAREEPGQAMGMVEYCRIVSRYMGMRADTRYAEGFVAHQVRGFMPNYKLLP